jgi:signal transduction histidine kinase
MRKLTGRALFPADRLDAVNRYLSPMEDAVRRSGKIVKSLLEFSRRGQIELKENDVQEILRKTIDIVRHRCELEGIKIHTSFARDLPPVVCDFKRMQQPFLGIIFNAMEAMPEGGTLSISTRLDETGEYVCVDISDEGTGIPKEDVEKIFEPFYSTKEEGKGVGLGLSVAYGIVEQHYGKILVDSEMGKGTRFTIKLPAGDLPPTSRIKLLWMRSGGESNE